MQTLLTEAGSLERGVGFDFRVAPVFGELFTDLLTLGTIIGVLMPVEPLFTMLLVNNKETRQTC